MRCPVEIFTKRIDKVRDVISTHLLCYRSDRVKYNCVARRECQMSISPAIHHVVTTNTAALSPSLSWSLFSANQCSQRNPEFPQQVGLNDRPCQLWTVAEQINQFLPKHSAVSCIFKLSVTARDTNQPAQHSHGGQPRDVVIVMWGYLCWVLSLANRENITTL